MAKHPFGAYFYISLYCSHSLVPSVLTVTCGWSSHHGSIPPGPTYVWTCPALSLKPPAVICHHNLQIPHLWKTKEYSGQNNIMIYASFVRYFPFDMSNFSSWGKPVSGKEILKRKLSILLNHTINDNSHDLTEWQTCLEICKTSHHTPQHTNTNCWVYKALVAESRNLDCCFTLPLTSQNHKQSLTLSDFQWLHSQCEGMKWQLNDSLQVYNNNNILPNAGIVQFTKDHQNWYTIGHRPPDTYFYITAIN